MKKKLKIIEIGDKRLWKKSRIVKNPQSKEVSDLAKKLIEILDGYKPEATKTLDDVLELDKRIRESI